jgi:hypothetical protein
MIILKVMKPGHTIAIPGLAVYRSPVEIDISKLDIRVVAMYLETAGIVDYEIIAEMKKDKEIYTAKDFSKEKPKKVEPKPEPKEDEGKISEMFGRMEQMFLKLIDREKENNSKHEEQIIDKLEKLERKIGNAGVPGEINDISEKYTDDDYEAFIPDIDISDMKLTSSDNIKKVKKEGDSEGASDALAGLIGKKK